MPTLMQISESALRNQGMKPGLMHNVLRGKELGFALKLFFAAQDLVQKKNE